MQITKQNQAIHCKLDEKTGIPLYKQLSDIFIRMIDEKQWLIGAKIPSEAALCTQYNVSRTTVRLALQVIENKGLLYRKPGSGTTVIMPKIEHNLTSFYSFSENLGNSRRVLSSRILGFSVILCERAIAEKLEMQVPGNVFCLVRVRLMDGTPFAYETSYIPVSVCPALSEKAIETDGLYHTILDLSGNKPDRATESFSAELINKEAAKALGTAAKQPALYIERVTSANGLIVEYCTSIVRGDSIKYKVVLE